MSFTKKCCQNILEKKKWSINYRKELIQDKILRNVKKLLKAKKTNRLFVNLDLDLNDLKIFNDDKILNREIDLMRDENQDNFYKSLWGSYWMVGNKEMAAGGRTFSFIKNIRISMKKETFALKIKLEKTVSTFKFSSNI